MNRAKYTSSGLSRIKRNGGEDFTLEVVDLFMGFLSAKHDNHLGSFSK